MMAQHILRCLVMCWVSNGLQFVTYPDTVNSEKRENNQMKMSVSSEALWLAVLAGCLVCHFGPD